MRIALVIGTVTLNRSHPSLHGGSFRLAVPYSQAELTSQAEPQAEPLVILDELGSGPGSQVAVTEGMEATNPFHPDRKPIAAYCAAILDRLDIVQE